LTRYSNINGTTRIGSTSYTYDADNRLVTLQYYSGSGTVFTTITYLHDPGGRADATGIQRHDQVSLQ
jgi:hypothetical protein